MIDLLGAWPILTIFAAALVRLLGQIVVADAERLESIPFSTRLLIELLSVSSQVLIVAAGVGFALLFGRRLGL